jgi:hypothetical protein
MFLSPSQRPEANLHEIRRQFDEAQLALDTLKIQPHESLRDFEYRVKKCSDNLLSLKVAEQVQLRLLEQDAREAEEQLRKKNLNYEPESPYQIRGWRPIRILFLGGYEMTIISRFFARNKKRSEKGKGYHPGLVLLGISEQISPAMLEGLAKSAAALGSMRDAQTALADQGINVSLTRISTAVRAVALKARCLRKNDESIRTLELQGRKIIVSIDGGRIRIRENKKGPKTAKNRTRYSTEWREPKLLCIYFLNEKGDVDPTIPPILDGTMAHVDEIFKMLCDYLSMLSIDATTEVLYVSDGAECQWKRVHLVEQTVRAKGGRFTALLDYYHMKGYLYDMAGAVKGWTQKKRTQWIRRMTTYLFTDENAAFEREVETLKKNSRKKSILRTAGNYLLKHSRAGHMNYGEARRRKLPIGSGVIESTVRRVVNLRLKGASVYWKEPMAEAMLLLRCLYKARRWKSIEKQDSMTITQSA